MKEKVTIKDLYEKAKEKGLENAKIRICYTCNDDWYNYSDALHENDICFGDNVVIIEIDN